MTLTAEIHEEAGVLWGQVVELPGCLRLAKTRTPTRRQRFRVGRMTLVDA